MTNPLAPIKPVIRSLEPTDSRKFCSFVVPNSKFGQLSLDTKAPPNGYGYTFISELKDRFCRLLGYEEFSFFKESKTMVGLFIGVKDEFQRKGLNFGEIVRLSSIIEIIENKIKNFDIVSKDSAIYFHAKYKFQPKVSSFYERNQLLKTVANDKSPDFEKIAKQAQDLLGKINSTENGAEQRRFCEEANILLNEYISKAINDNGEKLHKFDYTMGMTLTDEKILNNRDFFNKLFQKHGIDYKI